eukprot:TRINITY_DN10674_c0_g1_i1.p1 TRINITY_DN10674_c0_g1~~TRINITY_DN10674_c0_g1_i1.p1  ORF type:complete len:1182 (+),score=375.75 TRINITY_DN10674_c0_g1_i1:177-3722(+)
MGCGATRQQPEYTGIGPNTDPVSAAKAPAGTPDGTGARGCPERADGVPVGTTGEKHCAPAPAEHAAEEGSPPPHSRAPQNGTPPAAPANGGSAAGSALPAGGGGAQRLIAASDPRPGELEKRSPPADPPEWNTRPGWQHDSRPSPAPPPGQPEYCRPHAVEPSESARMQTPELSPRQRIGPKGGHGGSCITEVTQPVGTQENTPVTEDPLSKLDPEVLQSATFTLLHFNDVYHIQAMQKEPVGGAARFAHMVKSYRRAYRSCLLFSGDCYNPSLMSTVTKGKHMTPVLQALAIDCACFGNHDFDFGVEKLVELSKDAECPWVMTNVLDSRDGSPVAGALETYVFEAQKLHEHGTVRVGVMGIAEEDWLVCVRDLPQWVQYRDMVHAGNAAAGQLRAQGCEVVIALTHMRQPNDFHFAEHCPDVDMVLGGHDHFYDWKHNERGTLVLKSGTDFKNLSFVAVQLRSGDKPRTTVERIDLMSSVPEDPSVASIVREHEAVLMDKLDKELCVLDCELDVTTDHVRLGESSMGSFVADVMRDYGDADVAFVNSGVLRADVIYQPGPLTIKDILDIVPMEDVVVIMKITGRQLRTVLENGVSKWPQQEGRFLQISGVAIKLNPERPPHERIIDCRTESDGLPVDPDKVYTAVTTAFLCNGGDGFTVLKSAEVITDAENGEVLPSIIRKGIERMVPKEVRDERRESVQSFRRQMSGYITIEREKAEVRTIKRHFLPTLSPKAFGRIKIEAADLTALPPPSAEQSLHNTPVLEPALTPMLGTPVPRHTPGGSGNLSVINFQVLGSIREVKAALAAWRERFKDSLVAWGVDMVPLLGASGRLICRDQDGALLLSFTDRFPGGIWFPPGALVGGSAALEASAHIVVGPSIRRPSSRTVLGPGRKRSDMSASASVNPALDDVVSVCSAGSGKHSRQSKAFHPVPKERTMSFLMRPVTEEDTISAKDVTERSRPVAPGGMQSLDGSLGSRESGSPGDQVSDLALPRDHALANGATATPPGPRRHSPPGSGPSRTNSPPPRVLPRATYATRGHLWDCVWDGDAEAVEARVAEGPYLINSKGLGLVQHWEQHTDTHPGIGLGRGRHAVHPIHVAVARGHMEVLRTLLRLGADVTCRSDAGYNAREQACVSAAFAVARGDFAAADRFMQMAALIDQHVSQQRTAQQVHFPRPPPIR